MLSIPSWTYLGPPDSNYSGAMRGFMGLVLHIAEGSYQGTINWQKNPVSDVSSHTVHGKAGERAQMLDVNLTAWTQANGNGWWVSVEHEGFNYEALTQQQFESTAQLYAWLVQVKGVPLQLTDSPSVPGLGWHGMGGTAWGGHPNCPGEPIKAQRPAILARAQEILNGDDVSAQEVWDYRFVGPTFNFSAQEMLTGTNDAAWQCVNLLKEIRQMLTSGVTVPALVGLTSEALDDVEAQVYNVLNNSKIMANNPAVEG
jgi:hypothetical protein